MIMMQTHYYVSLPSPSWTDRQTAQLKQTNMSSDLIRSICASNNMMNSTLTLGRHHMTNFNCTRWRTDRPPWASLAPVASLQRRLHPARQTSCSVRPLPAVICCRIRFQCHSRFREQHRERDAHAKITTHENTSIVPVDGPTAMGVACSRGVTACSVVSFPHDRHRALFVRCLLQNACYIF